MTIHIEALTFDVIIGLLDFERDRPQRVIIDIEASYDYKDILSDTKGGKSKTTNKKQEAKKPRVKRSSTKSDTK